MVSRKAQMFVVTAVFLATMLFTVQEMFITYAAIDTASPFKTKELFIMRGIIESVNETLRTSATCDDLRDNLEVLMVKIRDDVSSEGFLLQTGNVMDCDNWGSPSSGPVLSMNIRLSETYDISGNVIHFYK